MTYLGFRHHIAHMRQHMTAYVALRKTFIDTLWSPDPVSLEYIMLQIVFIPIIEISYSYLLNVMCELIGSPFLLCNRSIIIPAWSNFFHNSFH